MANEEHLAILNQGVKVWNKWRKNNLEIKPDLNNANLSGKHLERANFYNVDFTNANLTGAYIYGTNFTNANLTKTKLCSAKAGLPIFKKIATLVWAWVISLTSGIFAGLICYGSSAIFDSNIENLITGIVSLILSIKFYL